MPHPYKIQLEDDNNNNMLESTYHFNSLHVTPAQMLKKKSGGRKQDLILV